MPLCQRFFPDLILARILFALGGASASCMITAILPMLSDPRGAVMDAEDHVQYPSGQNGLADSHSTRSSPPTDSRGAAPFAQIAGLVGVFSGLGALLALFVLLRLPAIFQQAGMDSSAALRFSFTIAAGFSGLLAVC